MPAGNNEHASHRPAGHVEQLLYTPLNNAATAATEGGVARGPGTALQRNRAFGGFKRKDVKTQTKKENTSLAPTPACACMNASMSTRP